MSEELNCGRDRFYRAFEDRHRGSRDLIKRRLEVYAPFVEPLLTVCPGGAVVDLGCGRGEWLELIGEKGFDAVGVDLDDGMLSASVGRELNVVKQDAIEFLRSLPDESQCVVSGFHLVEHIPFADLQVLVVEALRVLKPGGLLILETPNPENIVVGTSSFYLDPTHQRPIPSLLLTFLTEYYGFKRTKILRLQESPDLLRRVSVNLIDVLGGVSPDYAVVAQKVAAPEILSIFDEAFEGAYGVALEQLAAQYEEAQTQRFSLLAARVDEVATEAREARDVFERFSALSERVLAESVRAERGDAKNALLTAQLANANSRVVAAQAHLRDALTQVAELDELRNRLDMAERHALHWQAEAEQHRAEAELWHAKLIAVHHSTSWRITAPMRVVRRLATMSSFPEEGASSMLISRVRKVLRPLAVAAIRSVLNRPRLKRSVRAVIDRIPALREHLILFAINSGLIRSAASGEPTTGGQGDVMHSELEQNEVAPSMESRLSELPTSARRIYADLKIAIDQNNRLKKCA